MGIPHLITFLQPYASLESLAGRNVVIDGPAFAYHIYFICVNSRSKARGPFDAAPSYAEIGDTAIRWLDGVRESNGTIIKIYFDGFLPSSKLDVRLGRLAILTGRLTKYYHAHPTCHIPISNTHAPKPSLYGSTLVRSGLTALPPIPFLVPAVLEALRESKSYKDITEVVPGEADSFCSKYLSQHGGIVFTGDSDLLVHELGYEGAVSFFNSIQISSRVGPDTLQAQIYHPAIIAKRLLLPESHGLRSLAFEMYMDQHGRFPRLVARAKDLKAIQKQKAMYEDFRKEYISLSRDLPTKVQPLSAASVLRSLDPRISEFVLQFPALAELAGGISGTPSGSSAPNIFLPFLLDCAVRTNAWEMSTAIRQLAYGLINTIVPEDQQRLTIFEHKRQHSKSKGRELQLPSISEMPEACMAVVAMLTELRERLPQFSASDFWIAVAVYQDVEWSHFNAKPTISMVVKQHEFRADFEQTSGWGIIHFLAQIDSSYYSFRILKELGSLLIASLPEESISESILLLHRQLDRLPKLSQLKETSQASSIIRLIEVSNVSEIVSDMLGIVEGTIPIEAEASHKEKKRTKGKTSAKTSTIQNRKSSNSFDVLVLE